MSEETIQAGEVKDVMAPDGLPIRVAVVGQDLPFLNLTRSMRLVVNGEQIRVDLAAPFPIDARKRPLEHLKFPVNLQDHAQRRSLGKRIAEQVRTSRQGERFQYEPMADQVTLRKCHNCPKPATRIRVTETLRGIDKSSKVYCCEGCE